MAKGKQTRLSAKKKVIAAKLADPSLSTRDIEEQTGIDHSTIARTLKKIPDIATSCDNDILITMKNIVSEVVEITHNTIAKIKEKDVTVKDAKTLNEISEINWKRIQVMEGKPTERVDHTVVDFGTMTKAQKEEYRKKLLGK